MGDGKIMTNLESQIFQMYEEDKASQKAVDALNEIGCTSFMFTKAEIEQMCKDGDINRVEDY